MECDYQEAMNKMAYDSMYKLSNGEIVHVVDTSLSAGKARKPNWTETEIKILLDEYNQRKDLLRSKLSSTLTTADKQAAWTAIAASVNSVAGKDCFRTVREVQKKWENLNSKMKLELEQFRDDNDFRRLSATTKAMLKVQQQQQQQGRTETSMSAILNIPDCTSIKMEPVDCDIEDTVHDSTEDSPPDAFPHTVSTAPIPKDCVPVKLVQIEKPRKTLEERSSLRSAPVPDLSQFQPILPKPANPFDNMVTFNPNPPQAMNRKLHSAILSRVPQAEESASFPQEPDAETSERRQLNGTHAGIKRPLDRRYENGLTLQESKATLRLKRQILVLKKQRLKSDIERIELEKERLKLEKEKLQMEKETVALAKEKITLELANVRNILPLSYKS